MKKDKNLNQGEITILALHLGFGGIEQYIASLTKMLSDYKIHIIATYKVLEEPAFNLGKNVDITYLIEKKPNKNEVILALKEKKLIKLTKEIFIALQILFLKYIKNIIAIKRVNTKYIITTRSFHSNLVGIFADKKIIKIATEHNSVEDKKYCKKVIKSVHHFDYFVAVSPLMKKFYQNKIGNVRCIYIPNVIENLPKTSANLKNHNLISIGRLEPEKGFLDLIDIIYIVKKEIPDIKLFILGDGSLKEKIQEKINVLDLQGNVQLKGFIPKSQMKKYFENSSIYLMTSFRESFGLVLIEAMSYKLPCIAFDTAEGPQYLLEDDIGILIKNRNKQEYSKQIINLINNPNKLNKYAIKGYNYSQNYLIENVKKQWKNLLDKCNRM